LKDDILLNLNVGFVDRLQPFMPAVRTGVRGVNVYRAINPLRFGALPSRQLHPRASIGSVTVGSVREFRVRQVKLSASVGVKVPFE